VPTTPYDVWRSSSSSCTVPSHPPRHRHVLFLRNRHYHALFLCNRRSVIITAAMLAAKFFDDQYFNNAYYAKVRVRARDREGRATECLCGACPFLAHWVYLKKRRVGIHAVTKAPDALRCGGHDATLAVHAAITCPCARRRLPPPRLSIAFSALSRARHRLPLLPLSFLSSPAQVGGVPTNEVNSLELEFLFSINFSLHVPTPVFEK